MRGPLAWEGGRVHSIGIDLAWGERAQTGVAVLDASGRLVLASGFGGDEDILTALRPYAEGPCVVAFDAPLVVTNATGSRPAERELNRDFARFDAGAHPSNLAKPEFASGTRAARLASALSLPVSTDPALARRAIEVYPHAACIAIFRLGRTLKYKNKSGRSLVAMRGELLRLTQLLASLADATPALDLRTPIWDELVQSVSAAERKADLRRAEDVVDAVLCAYVARLAALEPGRMTAYGSVESGIIMTPTLPADHEPEPRPARLPGRDRVVDQAVRAYRDGFAELQQAASGYLGLVREILDDAGINYLTVTGRAKTIASFAEKAARSKDGAPLYPAPLTDIADQIGIRVITYLHRDVAAVAELLAAEVHVLDDRDLGRETAREGRFGYASRHLQLTLAPDTEVDPTLRALLAGRQAQVQVRTVLQHAWAEYEHAIRYKGTIPLAHARDLDRRFTLAAGLLELADEEFTAIHEQLQQDAQLAEEADDGTLTGRDLAAFLAGHYRDAGWSREDHYGWMAGLLVDLGITRLPDLAAVLADVDERVLSAALSYRYPAAAVRRLDDALLARFGQEYVALPGNAHRVDLLRTRWRRLTGG